jgi:hypothetical protein
VKPMFDKTRERIKTTMDEKITQPIRNVWLIAIAALITGIIGIILAVRR